MKVFKYVVDFFKDVYEENKRFIQESRQALADYKEQREREKDYE